MAVRVSEQTAEASVQAPVTANARVTQVSTEASVNAGTNASVHVTQAATEVSLQSGVTGRALVTQLAIEVSLPPGVAVPPFNSWLYPDGVPPQNAIQVDPVNGGRVYFEPTSDAQSISQGIAIARRPVVFTLDSKGALPLSAKLFINTDLLPTPTNYKISVIAPGGAKVYGRQVSPVQTGSPIDLSNLVPVLDPVLRGDFPQQPSTSNIGLAVNVLPGSAILNQGASAQFSATVTGSTNTGVAWSVDGVAGGSTILGIVDATGLYAAPNSTSSHVITATSNVDNTTSDSSAVTVNPVIVQTTPSTHVFCQESVTVQFSAAVTGAANPAVTWYVDNIAGGNSTVGTIDNTGLYISPSSPGDHTIKAVSNQNILVSASVLVTVLAQIVVVVSPATATVIAGNRQGFTASVRGTSNQAVTWSVDGVAGGNGTVGTIDVNGNYTSPLTAGAHTITAASVADPSKTGSATATVILNVTITVSPVSPSVVVSTQQQFTATVTGTLDTAVAWYVDGIAGGNGTVGTITSGGLYTAPAAAGSHVVKAVSHADSSKSASTTVTVIAVAVIAVTVTPVNPTMTVNPSALTFTATVSGTSNQNVLWYVNNVQGGNSTVGTISTAGLYKAPSVPGVYTIKAVSQADTTKSDTTNVTVNAVSLFPSAISTKYFGNDIEGITKGYTSNTDVNAPLYTSRIWDCAADWPSPTSPSPSNAVANVNKLVTFFRNLSAARGGPCEAILCLCKRGSFQNSANTTGAGTSMTWNTSFLNEWAGVVQKVITTWGNNGSSPATDIITTVEIWNEPDGNLTSTNGTCLSPSGPSTIAIRQQEVNNWIKLASYPVGGGLNAYQALKQAGFRVAGPCPQGGGTGAGSWLDLFGASGGGNYVDVVTKHHYRASPEDMYTRMVDDMTRLQNYTNTANKEVWITECNGSESASPGLTEDQGIAFIQRTYLLMWLAGLVNGKNLLQRVYWYNYDSSGTASGIAIRLHAASDAQYPSTSTGPTLVSDAWGTRSGKTKQGNSFTALQPKLIGAKFTGFGNTANNGNWTINVTYADGTTGTITWNGADVFSGGPTFSVPQSAFPVFNTSSSSGLTYRTGVIGGSTPTAFWNFNLLGESVSPAPSHFYAARIWDGVGAKSTNGLFPTAGSGDMNALMNYVSNFRTDFPTRKLHLAVGLRGLNGASVNYQGMLTDLKAACISNFGGNPFESFEVWNEPTTAQNQPNQSGIPASQAALYTKQAYQFLKAWDANIIITSPSITRGAQPNSVNTNWLDQYFTDATTPNVGQYIDVWNVHKYATEVSPQPSAENAVFTMIQGFKNYLTTKGEGSKPLWLTEGANLNVTLFGTGNTSWAEEISYVRRFYLMAWAAGYLDRIYMYAWDNAQSVSNDAFNMVKSGALTQEGTDYNTRVYPDLLSATINSIVYVPDGTGTQWSGTWTVRYTDSGSAQHTVSWVTTDTSPTVNLP